MKSRFLLLTVPAIQARMEQRYQVYGVTSELEKAQHEYVIDYILRSRHMHRSAYSSKGVSISRNMLAKVLGVPNGKASRILKHLQAWSIIHRVGLYSQGKARTFQLIPDYETCKVVHRDLHQDSRRFMERQNEKQKQDIEASPLLKAQFSVLSNSLRINEKGLEYFKTNYPGPEMDEIVYWYQSSLEDRALYDVDLNVGIKSEDLGLFSILIGSYYIRRKDPTSRLYTNLTSLKREHREFLHLDGQPLVLTDIVSSQIVFSVAAIQKHIDKYGAKVATRRSLKRYQELATSGYFYEALADKALVELTSENRPEFKRDFFREVFFSRIRSKGGTVKTAFRRMFRPVAVTINKMKKGNYARFAVELQRMEAYIMVDRVLADLLIQGVKALSIHDSIVLSNQEDRRTADQLIRKYMKEQYGFVPKMKAE